MTLRLLDLFCGAGGAAAGYHAAGFEVVGVDVRPQPRFPFAFVQADALEVDLSGYAVVAASPPCQRYTPVSGRARRGRGRGGYADLIGPTRERLRAAGVPFVIENVETARRWMLEPVRLCGSAFGLDVRRHRLFESNLPLAGTDCAHRAQRPRFRLPDTRQRTLASVVGVHGHCNYAGEQALRERAMQIDWMARGELTQAVPPAYTRFIGAQLRAQVA